jgi:glutamyl-tRNA reductase
MRYNPGESIESWAERVRKYEYGYALQQIAAGQSSEVVLEAMSARIVQKLMHPIMSELNKSIKENTVHNTEAGRQHYEEIMKSKGLASDHVQED